MAIVFNNLSAGGGGKLYEHNIKLDCMGNNGKCVLLFSINSNDNTPIATYQELALLLNEYGYKTNDNRKQVSGYFGENLIITGITSFDGTNINYEGYSIGTTNTTINETTFKAFDKFWNSSGTFRFYSFHVYDLVREL